jgi:hypothetical protein
MLKFYDKMSILNQASNEIPKDSVDDGCDIRINPEYVKAIFEFAKKQGSQLGEAFSMFLPDVGDYEDRVLIRFFVEINEKEFQTSNRWAELWTDEEYEYAKTHNVEFNLKEVLDYEVKKKFSELEKTEFIDPYHIAEALQYYKLSNILKDQVEFKISKEEDKAKAVSAKFDSTSEPWDSDEDNDEDPQDEEKEEINVASDENDSDDELNDVIEETILTEPQPLTEDIIIEEDETTKETTKSNDYSHVFNSSSDDDNDNEEKDKQHVFTSNDNPASIINKTLSNLEDRYRDPSTTQKATKKTVTFSDESSSSSNSKDNSSSSSLSNSNHETKSNNNKLDFGQLISTLPLISETSLKNIAEKAKANKTIKPEMLDVILKTLSKSYSKAYKEKETKEEKETALSKEDNKDNEED